MRKKGVYENEGVVKLVGISQGWEGAAIAIHKRWKIGLQPPGEQRQKAQRQTNTGEFKKGAGRRRRGIPRQVFASKEITVRGG